MHHLSAVHLFLLILFLNFLLFVSGLVQRDNILHFNVQHLMRKLGSDPYIGQRVILSVSQRISMAAESLLFMDPFDGAFPKMHNSMYTMLVSDYSVLIINLSGYLQFV